MGNKNKKSVNLTLIIGILGIVAGVGLLFGDSWLIGIFGSITGAGLAYKGFRDSKD